MNLAEQLYSPSHPTSCKMQTDLMYIMCTHILRYYVHLVNNVKKKQHLCTYGFLTDIFCFSCRSTSNQIEGRMEYTFKDEDAIQPVSFLNELRSQTGLSKLTMDCKCCNCRKKLQASSINHYFLLQS